MTGAETEARRARWKSIVHYIFQDPSKLDSRGYPSWRATVIVALSEEWNSLLNSGRPTHEAANECLCEMELLSTGSRSAARVSHPNLGGYHQYQCSICGGGLDLISCPVCGHEFKDNGFRSGGPQCAPPAVLQFLRDKGILPFPNTELIQAARDREANFYYA